MKAIATGVYGGYYLYWGRLSAVLGGLSEVNRYPECLAAVKYEPSEDIVIPGEFL